MGKEWYLKLYQLIVRAISQYPPLYPEGGIEIVSPGTKLVVPNQLLGLILKLYEMGRPELMDEGGEKPATQVQDIIS